MIYRVVNEERLPLVKELWDYCFEKQDEPFFQYYFTEYCLKNNMVIGGFDLVGDKERLRTMVHVNPYMLRIRGKEQLVPYLVGVATAPEARGQHAFAPLLSTTFDVLRSEGFTFANLMPIYAGIYLPYEFAYCYYCHRYTMPLAELGREMAKAAGSELVVEREALQKDILAPLYAKYTANYNGVPVRTDFQWQKLLTVHNLEGVQCAVVYRNSEASGYMLYRISDSCFTVLELLTDAYDARNRLLQYAAMHQSSAQKFAWLAPDWDKTYLGFANQEYTGALQPFMMTRCLDARKALNQLDAPADMPEDSVVLLLTDKTIDRNSHLLKLYTAPNKLEVKSTIDAEEVTMDMAAFTQMYMGAFTATELWEAGRVRAATPEKLVLLDKLLPKCRNFINEYF